MKNILLALLSLLSLHCFTQINEVKVKVNKQFEYETLNQEIWNLFLTPDNTLLGITDLPPGYNSYLFEANGQSIGSQNTYKTALLDQDFFAYGGNTQATSTCHRIYIQLEDRLYAFGQENPHDDLSLIALPIDNTGKPKGNSKKLLNLSSKEDYSTNKTSLYHIEGMNMARCILNYSSDGKKLLILHAYKDLEKKDGDKCLKLSLSILDKNLNKVVSSEILSPHSENKTKFLSVTSDSKNNIYLFSEVNEDHSRKYELDVIAPNSTDVKKITLESNIIFGMDKICIAENKTGEIYAYGYSNTNDPSNPEPRNIKLYKIDPDKGSAKQIIDAPLNFRENYREDYLRFNKNKSGGTSGITTAYYKLRAQQIIFREDGSMVLIGAGNTGGFLYNQYFDGGFIATCIDPSGKLKWTNNIFDNYFSVRPRPVLYDQNALYILSPTTEGIQKLNHDLNPSDLVLSKINFDDGHRTDQLIMKDDENTHLAMTHVFISKDGKTLIADVSLGCTQNKEKPKEKFLTSDATMYTVYNHMITVGLK